MVGQLERPQSSQAHVTATDMRYEHPMLMFVFGAGASFDSDPQRRPGDSEISLYEAQFRPPLAMELFTPQSDRGKEIVGAFPRAAPLIMQLRQAVAQGEDIEEVLEMISASSESYPARAAQLLAFRGYLTRLLSVIPGEWADHCQGLTNYVRVLDEAGRWNAEATHANADGKAPIACVNFNYDLLLEQAVDRAFGHRIDSLGDFNSSPDIHIHKPHGSVSWRQAARWSVQDNYTVWPQGAAFYQAVQEANSLEWLAEWTQVDVDEEPEAFQDASEATKVWLPALSIPVRRKSEFTMPDAHKATLIEDVRKVTTMVAVGWRARERHFLRLLQDEMPSQPARLVVVAPNDLAAMETINNLWETGRFDTYAISGRGFSGFTDRPTAEYAQPGGEATDEADHMALTITEMLSAERGYPVWTRRSTGSGLGSDAGEPGTYEPPQYADL